MKHLKIIALLFIFTSLTQPSLATAEDYDKNKQEEDLSKNPVKIEGDQGKSEVDELEGMPISQDDKVDLNQGQTNEFNTEVNQLSNVVKVNDGVIGIKSVGKESKTSRLGHLKTASVRIYKNYEEQSQSVEAGTTYTHEVYYIKKQAIYNEELYYLISRNPSSKNGVVGWVKSAEMTTFKHVKVDATPKTVLIKGSGSAYTKAWGGRRNYSYQKLSELKDQKFVVSLTERVGDVTWYRGRVGGKIAWIHEANLVLGGERRTSRSGHLNNPSVRIYKEYKKQNDSVQAGARYTHEVYYIKKQAIYKNDIYYLISRNPSSVNGVVGWVKSSDIKTLEHVKVDDRQKSLYIKGSSNAYGKAWGGRKNIAFQELSKLKGEKFVVNLTERIGDAVWYRGKVEGKNAWIHSSNISTVALKNSKPTYIDGVLIASKKYPLPKDYAPGESKQARSDFNKMIVAGKKAGFSLTAFSTYRSYEYQKGLFDRYVRENGVVEANRFSARAGQSEHQTGLAFDVGEVGKQHQWARQIFGETKAGKWIAKNAHHSGFIIRYPKDKEDVTGYIYEPWHLRYVGKELATKVYNSGLTLEEYLSA